MKLGDLLDAKRILIPLAAGTLREASQRLGQTIIASGGVRDGDRLNRLFEDEWPEDIRSVGQDVFLPHFRTGAVTRAAAALGVAQEPIFREHDPKRCARIVVLVVAPLHANEPYLQAVGAFSRALGRPDVVESLLRARSPADVLALARLTDVEILSRIHVRDVMSTVVHSIRPDEPVMDAARRMVRHRIRALPVVDEDRSVIGMITDRVLIKHLLPPFLQREQGGGGALTTTAVDKIAVAGADPSKLIVRDVMERSVLCVPDDDPLVGAARLMVNKDLDRLPVTREGVLVGFLTRADVVRRLATLHS